MTPGLLYRSSPQAWNVRDCPCDDIDRKLAMCLVGWFQLTKTCLLVVNAECSMLLKGSYGIMPTAVNRSRDVGHF